MPLIPAFCDSCGAAFPSGFFVENCINLSLSGNRSGPCPKCGGMGHVPDGVFNVIGNTIEILSAPERTVQELTRLAEILNEARRSGAKPGEVAKKIEQEIPGLAILMQLMPESRSEWFAFIGVVLAAIQVYLAACPPASNQIPANVLNITINQVIEQTIVSGQTDKSALQKRIGKKIGRNEPCSC